MSDLKPCPFCGSRDISDEGHSTYRWARRKDVNKWWPDGSHIDEGFSVNCKHCFASTHGTFGGQQTKELAIAAWNTRPVAEVPSVEALLGEFYMGMKSNYDRTRMMSNWDTCIKEGVGAIRALLTSRREGE